MTLTSSAEARPSWSARGLATFIDHAAASHKRAAALLVLVSLVSFLPGFFQLPPVDRDEAYFAQATRQMLETGDYVDIRYQDDVRYRKPVGIYWLQAGVVKTAEAVGIPEARSKIWLYRLPSLAGGVGAVLATYWCALAFISRRGALLAALMMAASIDLGIEARLAKTDAVLLFTVVLAMGVLARAYLRPDGGGGTPDRSQVPLPPSLAAIIWTALAAGILVKGPLILMVVILTAATVSLLDRSLGWLRGLRPFAGSVWLLLLVLPWFIAISLRSGSAFFLNSVGHDMLAKVGGGQEAHGAPPGTYLLLFFVTFFPASALALPALPAVWATRRERGVRFLLAWLVPSWIVFELVPTKLPHYVLPLYPAIAILLAGVVEAKLISKSRWLIPATTWWFVLPSILSAVAIGVAIFVGRDLRLPAWPFFAAAIVAGLFAWLLYENDGAERALLRGTAAAILTAIGIYGLVLPPLSAIFPSVALAGVLRNASCPHPVAASSGYEEPSLAFLAGTATRFTDPSGAADFLLGGGCRFAFITTPQEHAFALRAEAVGLHYRAGPRIEGFNISTGRRITIAVFQSAAAQ